MKTNGDSVTMTNKELVILYSLVHISEQCRLIHDKRPDGETYDLTDDAKQVIRDLNNMMYDRHLSSRRDISI